MKQLAIYGIAITTLSSSVLAGSTSFIAEWSNDASGASAMATFEMDLSVLDPASGPFETDTFAGAGVTSFEITITGASSGNGSWSQGDFDGTLFMSGATSLDPYTEWVGQAQDGLSVWGVGEVDPNFDYNHDFNFFGDIAGAPSGTAPYELTPDGGESLLLTSFRPAVPAPGSLALLGLGGIAAGRRRR